MSSLVDSDEWGRLLRRLDAAAGDHERLALLGHFVDRNEQVVRALIPADERHFIAGLDAYDRSRAAFLSDLLSASSEVLAAEAAVASALAFDRQLAQEADAHAEATGELAEVVWGPFEYSESGPLSLVRWARSWQLPIDDQGLVTKVLAHHRVLGRGPGGITWDLHRLGDEVPPGRRANLALLLGRSRSNWPIRIAMWPGSRLASADFMTLDGCAVLATEDGAADEIVAEALAGVTYAENVEAHVLVAPELFVPQARLGEIADRLSGPGRRGHPVLSVFGLSHRSCGDGWVNEAVVFDYQGTELWRHKKLAPFAKGDVPGECLRVGRSVGLRHTPAGWVMVLICLDLFSQKPREAIMRAAPALVLSPSLSRSTSAHLNAAREAQASGIAVAVANRPLDVAHGAARSFFSGRDASFMFDGAGFADWMPGFSG